MALLILPVIWIALLSLITALCVAARRGDSAPAPEHSDLAGERTALASLYAAELDPGQIRLERPARASMPAGHGTRAAA